MEDVGLLIAWLWTGQWFVFPPLVVIVGQVIVAWLVWKLFRRYVKRVPF